MHFSEYCKTGQVRVLVTAYWQHYYDGAWHAKRDGKLEPDFCRDFDTDDEAQAFIAGWKRQMQLDGVEYQDDGFSVQWSDHEQNGNRIWHILCLELV